MKYLRTTLILIAGVFCMFNLKGQTTPIPDLAFEQSLVDQGIDSNGITGDILNSDAEAVYNLNVDDAGIFDLTGIEAFINLVVLSVDQDSLSSIDLSHQPNLQELYVTRNKLSSIDLSQLPDLKYAWLYTNQLTELDVSNNPLLEILRADYNQLTSIDVSNNTMLTWFDIGNNQLTSLDLSNNDALTRITVWYNQLSDLDVSNMPDLDLLLVADNPLGQLDLTQNTNLERLNCDNTQLTELDLSQNDQIFELSCANNQLSELDVSNMNLTLLTCEYNQITALDVNQPSLIGLFCGYNQIEELELSNTSLADFGCFANNNNLHYLNIQNGHNQEMIDNAATLFTTGNPDLECIQVDSVELAEQYFVVDSTTTFSLDCGTTDIDEQDQLAESIQIFPNPVKDVVNVSWKNESSLVTLFSIRSIAGQEIETLEIPPRTNNFTFNMPPGLPQGLYLLTLQTGQSIVSRELAYQQ